MSRLGTTDDTPGPIGTHTCFQPCRSSPSGIQRRGAKKDERMRANAAMQPCDASPAWICVCASRPGALSCMDRMNEQDPRSRVYSYQSFGESSGLDDDAARWENAASLKTKHAHSSLRRCSSAMSPRPPPRSTHLRIAAAVQRPSSPSSLSSAHPSARARRHGRRDD